MTGWVKLHRQFLEHWLFSFDNPDKALAWIFLFTKANHAPAEVMIKGKIKKVGRGQLAMSQLSLQKEFKWSQNKLKRFLKLLKNERMIDFETDELTTLITICNYESFQSGEDSDGRPHERTDGRPVERTTDDQSNDKQECNKKKNEKKTNAPLDYSSWPTLPSKELSDAWLELRKSQRAKLSQPVINRFGKELVLAIKQGFTVDQCFEMILYKGWRGFEAGWMKNTNVVPLAAEPQRRAL